MRIFLEPTEPLMFRRTGSSFDAGESSYADTLFPPTPETLQGAIRAVIATHWAAQWDSSKTLAEAFEQPKLVNLIGNRSSYYGRFRITSSALGRRKVKDGSIERLFPAPSHLRAVKDKEKKEQIIQLIPQSPAEKGVDTDLPPGMQLLYLDKTEDLEEKVEPLEGCWLTEQDLLKILRSEAITQEDIIKNQEIFDHEPRLGIGMDNATKTTREGMLYMTRMIRMNSNEEYRYGFVIDFHLAQSPENGGSQEPSVEAMTDDDQAMEDLKLAQHGWITLGGERRVARFEIIKTTGLPQQADLEQAKEGNLLYLATPAAFNGGWRPSQWDRLIDSAATPIAAAIHRYQSIGGWQLTPGTSGGENKSMRRCVPAGSVYFFDRPITIKQPLTNYGWQIGYGITYAGEWKK